MTTIFVLDDDRVFRELLKTVFQLEGYQTTVVPAPDDLVPMAREAMPDLVLMDVHMAHGDTFDAVRQMRAEETLQSVPVIMTSGMDHRAECKEAGADVFLAKPFRPPELLGLIGDLIEESGKKS